MAETLFLIDGSAFAYRSFFAIRGLTDSRGRPTNAVFGFARMLTKLLRENDPDYLAVVFDAPGKTFREALYPDYKANRQETPEDLVAQMPLIDAVVEAFSLPLLRMPGVEADDVMGTLARTATAAGIRTVLITGDKDFLQSERACARLRPQQEADEAWSGVSGSRSASAWARTRDRRAHLIGVPPTTPGGKIGPVAAET